MTREQALQVIKQALDMTIAAGVFKTMNDAAAVLQAYNVIHKSESEVTEKP
jgi:hypothetical protein